MTSLSKYLFYKVLIAGNVYLVCIVLRSRERERERELSDMAALSSSDKSKWRNICSRNSAKNSSCLFITTVCLCQGSYFKVKVSKVSETKQGKRGEKWKKDFVLWSCSSSWRQSVWEFPHCVTGLISGKNRSL